MRRINFRRNPQYTTNINPNRYYQPHRYQGFNYYNSPRPNTWYNNWNRGPINRFRPNISRQMNYIPNFVLRSLNTISRPNNNNNNNNNRRRNNNNNNNNNRRQEVRETNRRLNEISRQVNANNLDNKTLPNVFKNRKEMRADKLISAMNMSRYNEKLAFYKTPKSIVKFSYYQKVPITVNNDQALQVAGIYWFPYVFPWVPAIKIRDSEDGPLYANGVTNMVFVSKAFNAQLADLHFVRFQESALYGQCRLIAATLKVTNISPAVSKSGSFTIYKLLDTWPTPIAYLTQSTQLAEGEQKPKEMFTSVSLESKDQVPQKCLYTALDTALVNEYNVINGNNIFQGTSEYIGNTYSETYTYIAIPGNSQNPTGTNVKYFIDFTVPANLQSYVLEAYYVWEVEPHPATGLGGTTERGDKIFDSAVRDAAYKAFPFSKAV